MTLPSEILAVEPDMIRRDGERGWLAISPKGAVLRIAVVGPAEDEARASFVESLAAWARLSELAVLRAGGDVARAVLSGCSEAEAPE